MKLAKEFSLYKDTFFYSLANWGRRLIGLVSAPVLIAYFTPEEYGYFALINSIAAFCSILCLLAIIDQGLPRFFIDTKSMTEKVSYVSTSFFLCSLSMLFVIVVISLSGFLVPFIFKEIKKYQTFVFLIVLVCVSQSVQYVGSNMLKWTFQSSLFTKINLIQAILGAFVVITGVLFLGWGVKEVVIASALFSLFAGIWANSSIKDYIDMSAISKNRMKELATYSLPLLGLNIFAYFTRSLDRLFLASLASLSSVGIFSVSYTIASIFETAISGFFFAWGPYVLSTYQEDWAPKRYANFFGLFSCIGIVSIVVLGFWGSSIVILFRPDGAYQQIGIFIPWIVSGTLMYYLGGYFTPGPSIKKKTHWKLVAFIIAGTSNAILNYLLIPHFGILGAGIATTISGLLGGTFNQIFSNRLFYIPNKWIFSFLLILIFTTLVSFSQLSIFVSILKLNTLAGRIFLTCLLTCFAILFFFRDIQDSGVIRQFSKKIILGKM